ncbi:hypothetical protein SME20J_26130 [Serratia marcescens]|jgi:hypothetical protein|uniref:S-type pyocin domain-containing protein n=1 Tax=Serratia marcescens TaxID=615 RepID=UPI0037D869AB|nr:hypothetical protein SME20J_26130 [Serratia marcescens]
MTRYENTTQYERDVMTSMGYNWNGHGWQRGFDLSDSNMVVEAWVGEGLPDRQKELSSITHIWDQKISDINKSISAFDPDDDDITPFSNEAKESYREDSDKAIQFYANKVNEADNKIKEIQKDIDALSKKAENSQLSEFEKANLKAIISKLKVSKERLTILRNEANKRKVHQEYLKLNNESWFFSREKPTPWVREQQSLTRKEMGNKLEEEKRIQLEIDAAKQNIEHLESELREKEEDVRKADEAHKAKEARKAEAVRKALFAKAGVLDAPVYTPGMIKAANAAMATAGVMVLNRAGGMVQLSTWINSVMTSASELAGWVSGGVWRGAVEVSRVATLSAVAPAVGAFVVGFWPGKAGEGSDRVPGRDIEMFAAQAQLFAAGKTPIQPEMTTVDLPVRGFIRRGNNGQQEVILVKTGTGGVSATVPVYRPVRDETTGLDRITLPAVAGAPGRTILINPGTAPSGPWHTGNPAPAAPVTPVHTGTEIKQADSIVTTTFPAGDLPLQDFIYWQPDATGTGVEPVYVMLSGIYGETNAKGQYSGRDYNTDKAGGPIQNLDWKTAIIDRAGVDKVKLHTGRFGASAENAVMIDRLEKILKGELQATDTDKRYYTHEVRELERYRALGIADSTVPENDYEVWNNTHTATLEDYRLSSDETLLYTPEALNPQK